MERNGEFKNKSIKVKSIDFQWSENENSIGEYDTGTSGSIT